MRPSEQFYIDFLNNTPTFIRRPATAKKAAERAGLSFERTWRDKNVMGQKFTSNAQDPVEYWKIGGDIFPAPKRDGVVEDIVGQVEFDEKGNVTKARAARLNSEGNLALYDSGSSSRGAPAAGSSKQHKNPQKRPQNRPTTAPQTPAQAPTPGSSKGSKNPAKRAQGQATTAPHNPSAAPAPGSSKQHKNPQKRRGSLNPIRPEQTKLHANAAARQQLQNQYGRRNRQASRSRPHKNPRKRGVTGTGASNGGRSRLRQLAEAEQRSGARPVGNQTARFPQPTSGQQPFGLLPAPTEESRKQATKERLARQQRRRQAEGPRRPLQQQVQAENRVKSRLRSRAARTARGKAFTAMAVGVAAFGGALALTDFGMDKTGAAISGDPNFNLKPGRAIATGTAKALMGGYSDALGYTDPGGGLFSAAAQNPGMSAVIGAGAVVGAIAGGRIGGAMAETAAQKYGRGGTGKALAGALDDFRSAKASGRGGIGKGLFGALKNAPTRIGQAGRGHALGMGMSIGLASVGAAVAGRAVEKLSNAVLQHHGTSLNPKSYTPRSRTKRGSATPHGTARYSGDYSGIGATGNLVQALHQTGGSGGVIR